MQTYVLQISQAKLTTAWGWTWMTWYGQSLLLSDFQSRCLYLQLCFGRSRFRPSAGSLSSISFSKRKPRLRYQSSIGGSGIRELFDRNSRRYFNPGNICDASFLYQCFEYWAWYTTCGAGASGSGEGFFNISKSEYISRNLDSQIFILYPEYSRKWWYCQIIPADDWPWWKDSKYSLSRQGVGQEVPPGIWPMPYLFQTDISWAGARQLDDFSLTRLPHKPDMISFIPLRRSWSNPGFFDRLLNLVLL